MCSSAPSCQGIEGSAGQFQSPHSRLLSSSQNYNQLRRSDCGFLYNRRGGRSKNCLHIISENSQRWEGALCTASLSPVMISAASDGISSWSSRELMGILSSRAVVCSVNVLPVTAVHAGLLWALRGTMKEEQIPAHSTLTVCWGRDCLYRRAMINANTAL